MRAGIGWAITIALACAMAAHAAGMIGDRALDHVGLVSVAWATFRFAGRRGAAAWIAGSVAVALAGGLALLQVAVPELRYMPWLLIVAANMAMAWIFASGLLPGRQPVLLRLVLLMGLRPADDPRFRRFIAGQCLLWAVLAGATAAVAAAALVAVSTHHWLSDLLAGLVAVQVIWFAVSHHYAGLCYGRPETWWGTVLAMARPDIRSGLWRQ